MRQARIDDIVHRIWKKDDTVWGPAGQAEVADRLGWLTTVEKTLDDLDDLEAFAAEIRDEGVTDVVVLGMGGSSPAPEVLHLGFGGQPGHPRLHVLDSTDAGWVRSVQEVRSACSLRMPRRRLRVPLPHRRATSGANAPVIGQPVE